MCPPTCQRFTIQITVRTTRSKCFPFVRARSYRGHVMSTYTYINTRTYSLNPSSCLSGFSNTRVIALSPLGLALCPRSLNAISSSPPSILLISYHVLRISKRRWLVPDFYTYMANVNRSWSLLLTRQQQEVGNMRRDLMQLFKSRGSKPCPCR